MYEIFNSDCLSALKKMQDNSIDSIVTDPPAGIGFMGKDWDKDKGGRDNWIAWMQEIAQEAFRVVKPGAHALVWALPRTSHWTATAWENAGFEVRDSISHVFGSGFPKSMDIGKAIDKAAGAEREIVGTIKKMPSAGGANTNEGWKRPWAEGKTTMDITAPATESAKQWDGWGTALKPAREDWILLRKPFKGTVAENVLQWGTGGINVDGCRVGTGDLLKGGRHSSNAKGNDGNSYGRNINKPSANQYEQPSGRWPANFVHDGSDEVLGLFPITKSGKMGPWNNRTTDKSPHGIYGKFDVNHPLSETIGDSGSAARFFYCAKPSTAERNEGLDGFIENTPSERTSRKEGSAGLEGNPDLRGQTSNPYSNGGGSPTKNHHPTVKSISLMRYLCRLITPPGGTVLDMFMGSGTTIIAAHMEGFNAIGIEREEEYFKIAENRIKHWTAQGKIF